MKTNLLLLLASLSKLENSEKSFMVSKDGTGKPSARAPPAGEAHIITSGGEINHNFSNRLMEKAIYLKH